MNFFDVLSVRVYILLASPTTTHEWQNSRGMAFISLSFSAPHHAPVDTTCRKGNRCHHLQPPAVPKYTGRCNIKSRIQLRHSYYVEAQVLTDTITETVMYRRIQDMRHIS